MRSIPEQHSTSASPPLVFFSDDWGRHPSSSQHLVRKLMGRRQIIWVNTIGTRRPTLDWRTIARAHEKLRQWAFPNVGSHPLNSAPAPFVLSPLMWPSFRSGLSRRINRALLERALRPVVDEMSSPPIVVTTLPIVADLVGRVRARRWIYYCVDDLGSWPGYDNRTMEQMEIELVSKVDRCIAVSQPLVEHVKTLGKSAHLLTHGVDLKHWTNTSCEVDPHELAGLEPPLVVFWGVIDRRMDISFIEQLVRHLHTGTVVLVGPREGPDPGLFNLERVAVRPPVPYSRLPMIAAASAVLVMPYVDAAATQAMQPLKLKEYLATGKPVVVRALPSTQAWTDACDICNDPLLFAEQVIQRISTGLPNAQRQARKRLEQEDWGRKAQQFERLLDLH